MRSSIRLKALFFTILFTGILFTSLKAQVKDSCTYEVIIKFSSIGTGVPSDTPLVNYIKSFEGNNKIKQLTACRVGPMGKEGEYWLAFPLKGLTKKQKSAFKTGVKALTEKMTDRGQIAYEENTTVVKSSLGRASIREVIF